MKKWKGDRFMKKSATDLTLTVLEKLPDEAQIKEWAGGDKSASIGVRRYWHYCPKCKGWIEGIANESRTNTLAPHRLAGRSGHIYSCQRCGYEIGFLGVRS